MRRLLRGFASSMTGRAGGTCTVSARAFAAPRGGVVRYSDEVSDALANGGPVVALESTIISHGMPYPQNLETARDVESIVRDHGAVPATVAIMDGAVHIGNLDDLTQCINELDANSIITNTN